MTTFNLIVLLVLVLIQQERGQSPVETRLMVFGYCIGWGLYVIGKALFFGRAA